MLFDAAAVGPDDVVLEVGTGTGSLTALLAEKAAAVVTVEIDPRMFQLAAEELHRFDNVVMLQLDALKSKNRISPAVFDAVRPLLAAAPGRQFKLVANLPYNIATPILGNLLAEEEPPRTMTATIQKELAERITARPGDKQYGALSLWIQSQCRVEVLRMLPPEAFWPRPKVSSAFIQLTLDDAASPADSRPQVLPRLSPRHLPAPPQVSAIAVAQRGQGDARQAADRCHSRQAGSSRLGPGGTTRPRCDAGAVRGGTNLRIRRSGKRSQAVIVAFRSEVVNYCRRRLLSPIFCRFRRTIGDRSRLLQWSGE